MRGSDLQSPRVSVRVHDCPSCGATLKFHSSVAVFAVCEFCRSMVVLRDAKIESMGAMAELPPDLSPLQIGTRGVWNGEGFELVGRLRLEWESGSWSEWCAMFGGNRIGWIAEAQGYYMVTSEVAPDRDVPREAEAYKAGAMLRLDNRLWQIMDVKTARCIAAEGELPFVSPPGNARTSIDLMGEREGFATIELSSDGIAAFTGDYATFDSLQLSNLRPVPGWNAEGEADRNKTITLRCPNCGAPVNLRAAGQTMAIVCGSCGSVIDTANPQATLIQQASDTIRKLNLVLPIGTRGTFRATEYEVIGFARRNDPWASWDEYLLFNPWQGFRWLVTFRGHWSFVAPLLERPRGDQEKRLRDSRRFSLFGKGETETTAVLGEFYWKVQRGEKAMLADYVRPPYILSMEQYPGLAEVTCSIGEYVEHREVQAAFEIDKLASPAGIYLNQPNPHAAKWNSVKWKALLAVGLYLFIQFAFLSKGAKHSVFNGSFQFDRLAPGKVLTSERFKLDGGSAPVWIEAKAPVDNNWMGFDVDLVNTKTNQTYSADFGVEQYSGYDEGYWKEGSQDSETSLPSVPAGEYLLNIEATGDPKINQMPFNVQVKRGGLFWSNFWLGLVLLLIYPGWVHYRRQLFEVGRWSESDYSPYASSDKDND